MKSTVEIRTGVSPCWQDRMSARRMTGRQYGMTLIELIIALAVIGLIAGVTVMAVHQLLTASAQANDQEYAVSQLRQAEHWLTRDVLTAQAVTPDTIHPSGFPLQITWTSFTGADHTVTYTLYDMPTGSLKRLERIDVVDGSPPTTLWIAEDIDLGDVPESPLSACSYTRPVLTVTLTVTSGAHTETRTFQAKARSDLVT